MADDISQVVEVYISRETAQIDTASFDIPLLMVNLPDTIDNSGGSPVTVPADTSQRAGTFVASRALDVFRRRAAARKYRPWFCGRLSGAVAR